VLAAGVVWAYLDPNVANVNMVAFGLVAAPSCLYLAYRAAIWDQSIKRREVLSAEYRRKHEEELQRLAYERAVADEQHDRELEIVRAGGPEAEEIRARWEAERIAAEEARRRQNQEIIAAYEAKQLDKLDEVEKGGLDALSK